MTTSINYRAYIIYYICAIVGLSLKISYLNYAGMIVFIGLLAINYYQNSISSRYKKEALYGVGLLLVQVIVIGIYDIVAFVKYLTIFILYYILPNNNGLFLTNKQCKNIEYTLIILLVLAYITPNTSILGVDRKSGVFVNPNNMALISICALMYVDYISNKSVKIITYILIYLNIILTKTIGAFLGVLSGLFYRSIINTKNNKYKYYAAAVFIIIITTGIYGYSIGIYNNDLMKRINKSVDAVTHYNPFVNKATINYHYVGVLYGEASVSGVWRIYHWNKILVDYTSSSYKNIAFGHGAGSIQNKYRIMAHNEYIRILYEYGMLGLIIMIVLMYKIYKNMIPSKKYIFFIIIVYAITENIIDNYLFIILFTYYTLKYEKRNDNTISQ